MSETDKQLNDRFSIRQKESRFRTEQTINAERWSV